jgi:ketosteroid isomerase-like protein
MSEQNVEAMRRSNAAFNRGDLAGACTDFHPDVEYRGLQHPPDAPDKTRGIGPMLDILGQWQQSFPDLIASVEEFIDAGDAVVVVTKWHGKGAGSGIGVNNLTADVYEFSDGLVIRATVGYATRKAALKAVGLED